MGSIRRVHGFPPGFTPGRKELYTIWMKSLIMHGYGCTVFGPHGDVVYRVDNYRNKGCAEVFLMDCHGKLLFTIIRRKFRVLGRWDGYRCCDSGGSSAGEFCFQVRRGWSLLLGGGRVSAEVFQKLGDARKSSYVLEGQIDKSEFRVIDREGIVVAEVKRKESSSGVCLGEDVLALSMEAEADPSLIAALVAVYGSICSRM
ncbi:hypothetical protein MLD38_027787 [Melastoma candidum]|uniref:Uncharacterized protein n=1 Tax=Melastoma candidum TaxID=119954 RepID=A0ACB9P2P0_9MYRT|nr:hypothetical protein MLD38_027787 [Melastoma candidum]